MFSQACHSGHGRGGVSQHALGGGGQTPPWADTPSPMADTPLRADTPCQVHAGIHPLHRWPLQQMVRIPLECILVTSVF